METTTTPPLNPQKGITLEEKGKLPGAPAQTRSWKDICTGEDSAARFSLDPKIFDGKVTIYFAEGPTKTPNISFDPSITEALAKAWEKTLIFRPLGARFKLEYVARKIKETMQIKGSFKLSDLAHGYFLLKLEDVEDYEAILTGGPWVLYGHYLAVKQWTADFDPMTDTTTTTPVWVRIRNLPVLFYEESTLMHIAAGIGKPIKVDVRTLEAKRVRYAKVCVNLDLSAALPSSIIVQGFEYQIEFANL